MAWVTNDGASTINLSTDGPGAIFRLKKLLKTVGWTVPMSSDGSTYNPSGDQITHSGSGAGGMNNLSAWFRIQDPGGQREYLFQRDTSAERLKWHYSTSAKFVGGSPNATTLPTATDTKGLVEESTGSVIMFPLGATVRAHIAAQDTAVGGVYSWWLVAYFSSSFRTFMFCEAIDPESTNNDSDLALHSGAALTPTGAIIRNNTPGATAFFGWMDYGGAHEEWKGITALRYEINGGNLFQPAAAADTMYTDPHDTLVKLLPIHWFRHPYEGSSPGYKGIGKYMRWNPRVSTFAYTDLVLVGSEYYLVWYDFLLPGWPDATAPLT